MTAGSLKQVKAPLPGNIFKLLVKDGDVVKNGDVLLIMEAMKMENNILAEFDGVVKNLKIKEGQTVLQNDILLDIE
jgi:biotin carboxyl carrier protein